MVEGLELAKAEERYVEVEESSSQWVVLCSLFGVRRESLSLTNSDQLFEKDLQQDDHI